MYPLPAGIQNTPNMHGEASADYSSSTFSIDKMWLDRFSVQSSPSGSPPPQGRPYSPAPRRGPYNSTTPSLPPRPGINPRSSSLSLISSASETSLPATTRQSNGSTLRNELRQPADIPDPLDVLQNIMGKASRKRRMDGSLVDWKPSDIIEDIDFGSLSLEGFAAGAKGSMASSSIVQDYSAHSVDEYNRERERFEDLHRSITACDQVLKSVEAYLTGFQADLGAVSSEIETLQNKSAAMNLNLEKRRVVEKLLGPAVEDISLSPAVVKKISEEQIDESWVKALAELEKRCEVVETRAKEDKKMKAIHDLKPLLNDLIAKV